MKQLLKNDYDLIIDQGIKCYACCQTHFEELFKFYILNLSKNGLFITSKYGMNWSGYDIKKSIDLNITNRICHKTNFNKNKILTEIELKTYIKNFNLIMEKNNNIILLLSN